jgi:hypothetical protein
MRMVTWGFLARPPRLLAAVATLWLAWLLVLASDAGVGIIGLLLTVYGGLALALAWVVRGGGYLMARRRVDAANGSGRWWWAAAPLALLAVLGLSWSFAAPDNALFRLRFGFSEAAFTRHADRMLIAPSPELATPRRLGLFWVSRIETHEGQVRFITTSCGVVDACGLVYVPVGEPRTWQEDRFAHLRGRWWHLYEGF